MDATQLSYLMSQRFAGGIRKLARRSGWEKGDLQGVCWLAAARSIENFDPSRGELAARFWNELEGLARAEQAGHPIITTSIDDPYFSSVELIPAPEKEDLAQWRTFSGDIALETLLDQIQDEGIAGVARCLGCSIRTAQRRLKAAITRMQMGEQDFEWGGANG